LAECEILSVVDLLESFDDFRLLAHGPGKGLVGDGVSQAHALLVDIGKVIFVNG
jgi:hypothetical protein